MADFSFAPNPALGWGGRSSMGSALWQALQRGLGMQRMFEDQAYNSARHDMDMHLLPFDGERQYWGDRAATGMHRLQAAGYEDSFRNMTGSGQLSGDQMNTPNGYGFTHAFHPFSNTAMTGGVAGGYVSPNVGGPNTASAMFVPPQAQHAGWNDPSFNPFDPANYYNSAFGG